MADLAAAVGSHTRLLPSFSLSLFNPPTAFPPFLLSLPSLHSSPAFLFLSFPSPVGQLRVGERFKLPEGQRGPGWIPAANAFFII